MPATRHSHVVMSDEMLTHANLVVLSCSCCEE
jgi:hypothetical protein